MPIPKKIWTVEEEEAEKHYQKTTERLSDGRYMVRLPFKKDPRQEKIFGNSKNMAMKRFISLENRLSKNSKLKESYTSVMNEYTDMQHMEDATNIEHEHLQYFIPHHAVFKESSTTTKTRVVFDASAKTYSGNSLNGNLLIGPTIQGSIWDNIIQWRIHRYVMTADIEKMYRCILMHPDDQQFQQILWRDTEDGPIKVKRLNRVTFGVASAPFQAIRTLHRIADDYAETHPYGSKCLKEDFYVDDMSTGASTIELALKKQREVREILKLSGMNIRKWTSNHDELLQEIPMEERELKDSAELMEKCSIKTLGLKWNVKGDYFEFNTNIELTSMPTKRSILSDTAKLFDPIGWLAPIIIVAKLILQELWKLGLDWDAPVPNELCQKWETFRTEIKIINEYRIPRWMRTERCAGEKYELHGFADSSEKAGAACIYLKVYNENGNFINLITAKTHVAPIKKVTLPRLELNAALLLSELMMSCLGAINIPIDQVYAWTDSSIVIAWLSGHPSDWSSYVGVRVSEIHKRIKAHQWRHVPTNDNPADLGTRGVAPNDLKNNSLWWQGPDWLKENEEKWPNLISIEPTNIERKTKQSLLTITSPVEHNELLNRFSSLDKLVRTTALILRFLKKCKSKSKEKISAVNSWLTVKELNLARVKLIHIVQLQAFGKEIKILKRKTILPRKFMLRQISPFVDENGLLRVGGRLKHASLAFDQKHPIILPRSGQFTSLILSDAHTRLNHGGADAMHNLIRQQYWIINAKSTIRQFIYRCISCFRAAPKPAEQIMADLHKSRLKDLHVFGQTGMDYCGPFEIRSGTLRNSPRTKAWIAIFVCMSTRAKHLELVQSLSTKTFLAAFTRFVSRRSLPSDLYSDNATCYTGAASELPKLFLQASKEQQEVQRDLANRGVTWHFIPGRSPMQGGNWEIQVRSLKRLLYRSARSNVFTYEDLNTLLTMIEASLNSQPLCALGSDTENMEALTPGHFLTGRLLTGIPMPSIIDNKIAMSEKFMLVRQQHERFWRQWLSEYLHTLNQRAKWHQPHPNIKVGQLVILVEDNVIPAKWPMARIHSVKIGDDGYVRSVEVRTENSKILTRAIQRICPLPGEIGVTEEIDNRQQQ